MLIAYLNFENNAKTIFLNEGQADAGFLWALTDAEIQRKNSTNATDDPDFEITKYLADPNPSRSIDPLIWWQKEGSSYPKLQKISPKYLILQGTSVPSERVFSKAGNIITKKRNRLGGKIASSLVFLSENLK